MMQKRLRYAMPRKPLSEYKEDDDENDDDGDNGIHLNAGEAAGGSNVAVMAKRIHQMEKKKFQLYKPPAERPLAGDLSSSESEESWTDSADASLIDE